jgi:hypothetical protein
VCSSEAVVTSERGAGILRGSRFAGDAPPFGYFDVTAARSMTSPFTGSPFSTGVPFDA